MASLSLALTAAVEVNVKPKTESNVEVSDQDVAEWHRRGYFGGYREYREYWRGRRSVEEVQPEHEANIEVADQEAIEFRRGYYGGHLGYWRGRRSVEEAKQEEEASNVEVGDDLNGNESYGSRYYGRPYGYYGRYGHWRGRRFAEEMTSEEDGTINTDLEINESRRGYYGRGYWRGRRSVDEITPKQDADVKVDGDLDANESYGRRYYGYPYSYSRYGYRNGYYW